MKKIICIMLALVMMLSTSVVFADTAKPSIDTEFMEKAALESTVENILGADISPAILDTAIQDVTLLDKFNMEKQSLIDVRENSDKSLSYLYAITDSLVSEITPIKTDEGVIFNIKEGDLFNEVVLLDSGEIYLNGVQVMVNKTSTDMQMRPRIIDNYYTATCPYGTVNDYSDFIEENVSADVDLGTSWRNITISAFALIFALVVPASVAFSFGVLTIIVTNFRDDAPYSTAASYEDYVYGHKDGYWVTQTLSVQKHSVYLWPKVNYEGNATHQYSYYCHEIEP